VVVKDFQSLAGIRKLKNWCWIEEKKRNINGLRGFLTAGIARAVNREWK
jgi:hypothetical protein